MLTRGDKILIILIILISLLLTFYFSKEFAAYNSKMIIIKVDGEEYKKIKLDENIKEKEILINTEYGYNLIGIDQGKVRVKDASCPDKLDIHQGEISDVGEIIVCLPNRLTIEIEGLKKENEIDKLSR